MTQANTMSKDYEPRSTGVDARWERILGIVLPVKDQLRQHKTHIHFDNGMKFIVYDLEAMKVATNCPVWAAELARGVRDTVIKGKPFNNSLGAYLQGRPNHYLARSSTDERYVLALSVHPFNE